MEVFREMRGILALLIWLAAVAGWSGPGAARADEVLQAAVHFGEWDAKYRSELTPVPHAGIPIEVGALPRGIGAQTRESRIVISQAADPGLRPQLVTHELGHVYFERACPNELLGAGGALLSESFSQWVSRDHLRIARERVGDDSIYASQALNWLSDHGLQKLPDPASLDRQVARALLTQRTAAQQSRMDEFWRGVFSSCRALSVASAESSEVSAAQALLKLLTDATPEVQRQIPDFAYLDDLTGDISDSRGQSLERSSGSSKRYPVASHLKPVLVALASDSSKDIPLGGGTLWECLKIPGFKIQVGARLDWREALVGSCNGFFTGEASPIRWNAQLAARWREYWVSVGASRELAHVSSAQEALGLLPGATLSLLEVLAAYRRLQRLAIPHAPSGAEVIQSLRNTAAQGTLTGLPDSDWFLQSGIALKSGTVRDSQGRPEQGWIVAIGPLGRDGHPAWYAAIHQQGASPAQLLGEFRTLLRARIRTGPLEKVGALRVQLGSVVAEERLEIGCRDGGLMISHGDGRWDLREAGQFAAASAFARGDRASCASGRIVLRSPDFKTGTQTPQGREREYPGREATWVAPGSAKPEDGPTKRARLGSRLLLETDALSYVRDVISAEFPEGREATLGALARAVYLNGVRGGAHRHPSQGAVCDSTHCQVYLGRVDAPRARTRRIERAVAGLQLVAVDRIRPAPWFPFSLGGRNPWQKWVGMNDINLALKLGLDAAAVSGELHRKLKDAAACERIRNALKLSSCPSEARPSGDGIQFSGAGQGHGAGLDLLLAEELAQEGRSVEQIWERAFSSH